METPFTFTGKDGHGRRVEITIWATSKDSARAILRHGINPSKGVWELV